jgi:hypothetical protein
MKDSSFAQRTRKIASFTPRCPVHFITAAIIYKNFSPEDGGIMFLRHFDIQVHMALLPIDSYINHTLNGLHTQELTNTRI